MNSIKMVLLLTTTALARYNTSHVKRILEFKENFFNQINGDIRNITHRIFVDLLKNEFAGSPKNKLYLSLHNDLNSIAEKNYEKYIEMKIISKPEADKTVIKKFFSVTNVVKDILYNEIYGKPHTDIYDHNITSDIENSREFVEFVRNFESKIKSLKVDNLFKEIDKQNPKDTSRNVFDNRKKHLGTWRPKAVVNVTRRVYRGMQAKVGHYPFLASVHVMGQLVCGGSIIEEDLILTAASCLQLIHNNKLFRENPKSLAVRVGSTYATRSGELIGAMEVHFFPGYNPETLYHNLAIIRISRHIHFHKKSWRVKRIELDKNEGALPMNVPGILMVGWGATDKSNIVGLLPKMSVAVLDVYHLEECKDVYSRHYVTDRNFCAGFVSKGGGACNKDAGGPGVVGGLLAGVISFGPPACGTADAPTVFTKVGYYTDWIEEIMEQHRVTRVAETTLHSRPTYPRPVTPYIYPTRGPVHPIGLRNGPKPSMEAMLLKQILNEVIFSKSDVLNELMYIEPDWGEEDFNDLFTTRSPTEILPPPTTLPDDVLYGPMDADDIIITTQKPINRDHSLTNKSLVFGKDSTQPASLGLPTPTPSRRPWMTTPPIADEETTEKTTLSQLALRTNFELERNFNSESFSNNYEETPSESDDGEPNTNDFIQSANKEDTNSKRVTLREKVYQGKDKKSESDSKSSLPDKSDDTDEVYHPKDNVQKLIRDADFEYKRNYVLQKTKNVDNKNSEVETGSKNNHHELLMKDRNHRKYKTINHKFQETSPIDSESTDEEYGTKNINDGSVKKVMHHEKVMHLNRKLKNTTPVDAKNVREQHGNKKNNHKSYKDSYRGKYSGIDTKFKNTVRDLQSVDVRHNEYKKLDPMLMITTPIENESTDEEHETKNINHKSLRQGLNRDKMDTIFKDGVVFETESNDEDLGTNNMNRESLQDDVYRNKFNNIDTKLTNKVVYEVESNKNIPNNILGSPRQLKYEGESNVDKRIQNVLINANDAPYTQMRTELPLNIEAKGKHKKLRFNTDGSPNAEFANYNIQEPTINNIKGFNQNHNCDSKEIRILINNLERKYTPASGMDIHVDHGARMGKTMVVNTYEMDRYARVTEHDQTPKS